MDDFIGSVFGSLTVVGIAGRDKHGAKVYQCRCSECAKDPELFGDATFRSVKFGLINRGQLPCGCSKKPKWSTAQYRVLISRKAAGRYTAVVPDDAGNRTKVNCKCNADNCDHEWEASINSLLNNGTGCQKCAGLLPITEDEAIENIQAICLDKGWKLSGFKDGWVGALKSKLLLECSCGCSWIPVYYSIVQNGTGCPSCSKSGYSPDKRGWFYTYLWTDADTNHSFLKYGITNYPTKRLTQQKRNTKYIPTKLCSIPFNDGSIPPAIEKAIDLHKRSNNIPSPVTKEMFPDGHTETLPTEEWSFISNLIQNETMCRLAPI